MMNYAIFFALQRNCRSKSLLFVKEAMQEFAKDLGT